MLQTNQFLKPTSSQSNEGKVFFSRTQQEPTMGFGTYSRLASTDYQSDALTTTPCVTQK